MQLALDASCNSIKCDLTDGYMSSPERVSRGYEDPYYSQYAPRSGSITPVIDEEIRLVRFEFLIFFEFVLSLLSKSKISELECRKAKKKFESNYIEQPSF